MVVLGFRHRTEFGGGERAKVKGRDRGRGVQEVAGAAQTARLTAEAAMRDMKEWTGTAVAVEEDQLLRMPREEVCTVTRPLSFSSSLLNPLSLLSLLSHLLLNLSLPLSIPFPLFSLRLPFIWRQIRLRLQDRRNRSPLRWRCERTRTQIPAILRQAAAICSQESTAPEIGK